MYKNKLNIIFVYFHTAHYRYAPTNKTFKSLTVGGYSVGVVIIVNVVLSLIP